MLPVFTITFVLGLILGSYLSYFPLEHCSLVDWFCRLAHVSGIPTCGGAEAEPGIVRLYSRRMSLLDPICLVHAPRFHFLTTRACFPLGLRESLVESVRHSPGQLTALVEVTAIDDPAFVVPLHLRLTWRDPDRDLHRGLRIRARTHLHAPLGTLNPRGFDYAATWKRKALTPLDRCPELAPWRCWILSRARRHHSSRSDRRMAQPGTGGRGIAFSA